MMTSGWSETLIAQTKEALESKGMDLVPTPDGRVHFKNRDGRYGSTLLTILFAGRFEISESDRGDVERFSTPEALVAAGWVLD